MLNLAKVKLPDSIELGGKYYPIKTDFRDWLNFSRIVNTKNAVIDELDFLYLEEVPPAELKKEAFHKLCDFFQPESILPRKTPGSSGGKILDFEVDADIIYASFYEQYKIDLLATDDEGHALCRMHWHKFQALLSGLHGTRLNEIMSYRSWKGETKTEYGKEMQKLRTAWELPTESEKRQKDDLAAYEKLFK